MIRRRKLIEVAMPLQEINVQAAREKSIRHGHPSTLHLWWARRPLAACRAVLFAQLVDDPASVPDEFLTAEAQEAERERLHRLLAELVKWENSTEERVLAPARREIARSIARWRADRGEAGPADERMLAGAPSPDEVRRYLAEHAPPVHDPFCGGGSIPLEAQRLGLPARGSDLNPVAVLITKALVEIPPRFADRPPVNPVDRTNGDLTTWRGAQGLAADVRHYGAWMREEAERRIGRLYPKVRITPEMARERPDLERYAGRELTVIAWLWARTVRCPNPACGATMPLVRSFWLSKKKNRKAWVEPVVKSDGSGVEFRVATGEGVPQDGTVNRRGARCLVCGEPVPFIHVRAEGMAGRMDAQLMAIVLEGDRERVYIEPLPKHEGIAKPAEPRGVPESEIPEKALGFRVQAYGMTRHRDLFTPRQLVALTTFSDLVEAARRRAEADAVAAGLPDDGLPLEQGGTGARAYGDAVGVYLGMAVSKFSNLSSSITSWMNDRGAFRETFARQAIPMVWDFAEANPFSVKGGAIHAIVDKVSRVLRHFTRNEPAIIDLEDANLRFNQTGIRIYSTDPPYYDNIGYADLSDFFYVWLRRSLKEVYPSLFGTMLTPKEPELIATPYRERDLDPREFFEQGLRRAFGNMAEHQAEEIPLTVFYAFKQSESDEGGEASTGWETMLQGLVGAGLTIEATWPMRTESTGRIRNQGSNALASSIVLVCRKRPANAPLTTRRELQSELRRVLPEAVRRLQAANIAPVDLAQSAIGPGMAVFSRYARVMEPDGSDMSVRQALALINRVLDEVLAAEEGEYDPDTRWAVTWFEQHGYDPAPFGEADVLARARNTSVRGLVEAGILASAGGSVRLLRREELLPDWDPATDARFTVWEACQYLIRELSQDGEAGAARLLGRLGPKADDARRLAYRLYQHCERKKWADEARAYNELITAWPRMAALAAGSPGRPTDGTLDFGGE